MKKFIETIKNIYKIEELRKRIGYTILLVLVYRLGSYILLPGLDPNVLKRKSTSTPAGEGHVASGHCSFSSSLMK